MADDDQVTMKRMTKDGVWKARDLECGMGDEWYNTDANPATVVRLMKDGELRVYRLDYAEAAGWYYVTSTADRVEQIPSLDYAVAKRALLDDEVAQLLRRGWTRVE